MVSSVGARSAKTINHQFIVKNFGEHTIEPGYEHSFNLTEGCEQDVKIVYANGHWSVDRDVDTCENDLATHY